MILHTFGVQVYTLLGCNPYKGLKGPHGCKDPSSHVFWNQPCLGPWSQAEGSLRFFGVRGAPLR